MKKTFISDRYNAYIPNRVAKFFSKLFPLYKYFISANTAELVYPILNTNMYLIIKISILFMMF